MEEKQMKNQNPLLSIIIPVYNVDKYIGECLLSVVRQKYSNMEIIVVDDGSTDNSLQVAEEVALGHTNIHIYTKQNGGLSDARNFGLEKAKGDFITFIDSDDVLLGTDIFGRVMQCFAEDELIDVVQYDVIHKWNSTEEYKRHYPHCIYSTHEEITKAYLTGDIHVSCCDKVFKRSIFDSVKFPLRQQCEDVAVIALLIEKMDKLQTANIGHYGYRFREGSISTSSPSAAKIIGILTSYHTYLSYAYRFPNLRALVVEAYAELIWNYCSAIRRNEPKSIDVFLHSSVFIRINVWEWMALWRQIKKKTLFRSFVSCVLGPRFIVAFQKIVTR